MTEPLYGFVFVTAASAILILVPVIKKHTDWDFPSGAVVKNLPANVGDMGSSPGPGRSHMLQSN